MDEFPPGMVWLVGAGPGDPDRSSSRQSRMPKAGWKPLMSKMASTAPRSDPTVNPTRSAPTALGSTLSTGEAPQPEALKALLRKHFEALGEMPSADLELPALLKRCTPSYR